MSSKIDRAIQGTLEVPRGFGTILKMEPLSKEKKYVGGFDIEADAITAEPFLLTYCNRHENSYILLQNPERLLDFFTNRNFRESINFFYNLQYDFEGLLKLFQPEISVLIYGSGLCYTDEKGYLAEQSESVYRITYINKKAFHIKVDGQKKYSYYDLLQYYQTGLDNASQTYLQKGKDKDFEAKYSSKPLFDGTSTPDQEILRFTRHYNKIYSNEERRTSEIVKAQEFFSQFHNAAEYRAKIIEYALVDAKRCMELGEIVVQGVNEFVNTRNFNSSATISEYYFRSNGIHVPKMSENVFKKGMQPYGGGRFEIMEKGFVQNISMYDIKSAYPYAMSQMPILSKTPTIKNVYAATDLDSDKCLFGSYCINVKIDESLYISPLFKRTNTLKFPTGTFTNYWVDRITLKLLDDLGFPYHINKAVEVYDHNADFRLTPLIEKLFAIKEDKKNQPEVVRLAAKIILNSLYGKFIQLVDDIDLQLVENLEEMDEISASDLFNIANVYYKRCHTGNFRTGKLFAPFYASYITSHTRSILYKTAWKLGLENVVGFHTDSIICRGNLPTGSVLGAWEIEELKDKNTGRKQEIKNLNMFLLKTGLYSIEHEGLKKIRARGVGKTDTLLRDKFTVTRRYGLRQAVKREFNDMNIISEEEVANNLNSDLKRVWNDTLSIDQILNEKKCITSRPYVI